MRANGRSRDGAADTGPGAAEPRALAPRSIEEFYPKDRKLPQSPTEDPYHYTFSGDVPSILRTGLEGKPYATTTGELSPLQAHIDLALPPNRGLPDCVLRIDLKALRRDGEPVPVVRPVGRHYNMPGGGSELVFPKSIDPKYLSVLPKE